MNKNIIYALLGGGILVGIVSTILLLRSTTETNSNASTPPANTSFTVPTPTTAPFIATNVSPTPATSVQSGTCSAPSAVQNVKVAFPGCNGDQCSFTQASCSWDAVTGAASYNLKVTDTNTGTVVMNQSISANTTSVLFNVTQGDTYKCDVAAVADCGTVGIASSDQLLCSVNGLLPSVSPTTTPAPVTPAPTVAAGTPSATLAPVTPTTAPVISSAPVSGPRDMLLAATAGGTLLMVLGGLLFLL